MKNNDELAEARVGFAISIGFDETTRDESNLGSTRPLFHTNSELLHCELDFPNIVVGPASKRESDGDH